MARTKEKKLVPKSKLVSAIRRLWLHSWQRREAIKLAQNHCQLCKEFAEKLTVDHIVTTAPLTGWDDDWSGYINRMFVDPANGLRALCHNCHEAITRVQNTQRKTHREKKRNAEATTKPTKRTQRKNTVDTSDN